MTYLVDPKELLHSAPSVKDMLKSARNDAAVDVLQKSHSLGSRKTYADGGMVMGDEEQQIQGAPLPNYAGE